MGERERDILIVITLAYPILEREHNYKMEMSMESSKSKKTMHGQNLWAPLYLF